ncbi:MAG: hypothetical protein WAW78_08325, partial [Propioniciclava sp.]
MSEPETAGDVDPRATPGHIAELLGQVPTGLLIDGGWRPAETGQTFGVSDPATGQPLLRVADASPADALAGLA